MGNGPVAAVGDRGMGSGDELWERFSTSIQAGPGNRAYPEKKHSILQEAENGI